MKLTEQEKELLVCLTEECGEVIQEVSKTLRHGKQSYYNDGALAYDNHEKLMFEIGNVLCVLSELVDIGFLEEETTMKGFDAKAENLKKYLHGELLG